MILIRNEQSFPIDVATMKQQAGIILNALNYRDFDLGILLATPEVMQDYNRMYRDQDKATDIISFPYHQVAAGERIEAGAEDDKNVGDIIFCPQYIHEDLARWDISYEERLAILLVHGICHLLGYDHIKDEDYEIMKLQEEALLAKLRQ